MRGWAGRGNVPPMPKRLLLAALATLVACGGSTPKSTGLPPQGDGSATATATNASTTDPAKAPADADAAPLPLWPKVKKGKLANGLTYYVLPHGRPADRAMLWLAVNAGSVQEDDDQRGLAHFDEHMAFNGTKRFPKDALVKWLESIGMRFGADLNAYTTWDQTVYQLEVPTDKPEFIGKGLDVLRDWAGNVTYDGKEIDKERGVVKEEWRLGRGAQARLFDKHANVLFQGSRYANRLTIGLPEILDKAPHEALTRYYKDWYRPDLMRVCAVGYFDPATLEKEIQARFGDLKAPAAPRTRPSGGVPTSTGGTRVSIETDREATGTSVTIQNMIPHRPEASKRDMRRMTAEGIYSMILNERFQAIARRPDAPFLGAFGGISGVVRDVDGFSRSASVKGGKVEDALRALLTEVVRVEKHGITATELERAKVRITRQYEQLADTEASRDSRDFTDELTRNFFEGAQVCGSAAEKQRTLEILPTLTLAELNTLGTQFGGADGRVVLISGPEGKPMPTSARILAIVKEVEKSTVTPWEDKAPQQSLMAKAPTPGKITKETKNDKVGVTEWTLSNGVRVIVKPTDFEVDDVVITGYSNGGEAMAPDAQYLTARWADTLTDLGGVGDFDQESLGKILTGKAVRVSTTIGETSESIDAGGSAKDLETMMQLVYLRITAPRKDAQQFEVFKANFKEQITNALRSPEFRYARESQLALWKGNVRRKPPEPTDVDKLDLDKALDFYKQRFGDVSDFTFVIVGDIKVEQLKPLVETYIASLPGKGRKEKEKDLKIRKASGIIKKEFKLGSEPKASVQLDLHGNQKWTRDDDRDMNILSSVLSMKLRETMREDMGGVYGVGARGRLSRSPVQERSFTISFGCDPARVDELVKAALDGAEKLKKDDVDAETLERVKQTFVRTRETDLRNNGFWLGWLASAYKYGDDPSIVLDPTLFTKRVTAANVKAAAKKFLDTKQYYQAVMLPEK